MYKRILLFFLILWFGTVNVACREEKAPESVLEETKAGKEEQETVAEEICVYVCGAVHRQGVYTLPAGSRVYEAVEAAGGFAEHADLEAVNQAEILEDEMQLTIPTKQGGKEGEEAKDGKVNLNTATKEELMSLSGVGEAKADSIIRYREQQGQFRRIEDIMLISGIKEGLFQKIKDFIKV